MTETTQADARAQDFPEEDREPSVGNCNHQHGVRCLIRRAENEEEKLRAKIGRIRTGGQYERARRYQNLYLRSRRAKLAALMEAYRKLKKHRRPPIEDLPGIAERLDPWSGSNEIVRFFPVPKATGGYRPIIDPDIENRALQILCARAMLPFADPHPNQFAVNGGRTQACLRLAEAIENEGFKWATEIDVKDCYLSFDERKIPDFLPLPERVARNDVLAAHLNLRPYKHKHAGMIRRVRKGFPQGSAASPLGVEIQLAPVIRDFLEMHRNVCVINYADNTWLLTRTKREACSTEALRDALRRHPAGPLDVRIMPPRRVDYGFSFLGYKAKARGGRVSFQPTDHHFSEVSWGLKCRLVDDLTTFVHEGRQQNTAEVYAKSFWPSFSLWDCWHVRLEQDLAYIRREKDVYEFARRWGLI